MAEENLNALAEETENPIVSQLNVAGVTYDIASKKLDNVHTIELTGDVTGSVNTDLGSKVEIATEIGAGKVGTNELADNAVTSNKIKDGAVTLSKIGSDAKGTNVSDSTQNDRLATNGAVKTYVDNAISGQGHYLGKKTVAQINALTNVNNSDRVCVTNSGTITDGNISVRAGEDLIYFKEGNVHHWDSMDGDFVIKNQAIQGATKCKVTYDEKGLVTKGEDLEAIDIPNIPASKITEGKIPDEHIAGAEKWDAKADSVDVELHDETVAAALDELDVRLSGVEAHIAEEDPDKWRLFKTVQVAKASPSASGTTTSFIDTISQDVNGEITATKKNITSGTTSTKGIVQLTNTASATDDSKAATPKLVSDSIKGLKYTDNAVDHQFVTKVSEENGVISVSRKQPVIGDVSGLQGALDDKADKGDISSNDETVAAALVELEKRVANIESNEMDDDPDKWKAFKTIQSAVSSPSASGSDISFIDTISQDKNGDITATKKNVRSASTSQTGIVQLNNNVNSTSTTQAATADAVRRAYELANGKQAKITASYNAETHCLTLSNISAS